MFRKSLITILLLLLVMIGCKNNPTYVGDTEPTASGFIRGSVIDATSKDILNNVKVVISDIMANSKFADSVITDSQGYFEIGNIYEKDYYLSFLSKGYRCKNILVSVTDTLNIPNPIALERNNYPYKEVAISEMPIDSTKSGYYYQLDPSIYSNDFSWSTPFNASEPNVKEVKLKIDSLIITLLRYNFKPDTLWYKFWQQSCGNSSLDFDPLLVIRFEEEQNEIADFNFIPYNFEIISEPTCLDTSETILINTFFDL